MIESKKILSPIFSIITVVYNRKEQLEKTILSIINQTYKNIDYVIIDGGSTDGTTEIIEKYKGYISYSVSEKDNGIYDAMNKGLKNAKGNYVWFLNAGDEIFSAETLQTIVNLSVFPDVFYGDVEYIDSTGQVQGTRKLKIPPKDLTWKSLIKGMVVSHQSFIVKKDKSSVYNLDYKYCADIDWMLSTLKKCSDIYNTEMTLSKFLLGGYSKSNIINSNKERYRILRKHFGFVPVAASHIFLGVKFVKYYFSNKRRVY